MEYKVNIEQFEGPLDLLLHLVKKDNVNIHDINIEKITKQYLEYIHLMEEVNLNVASEYLIMAAELIEIKSSALLPKSEINEDSFEENTKENLINRLINYEQYKNISAELRDLESYRENVFTREPNNLTEFNDNNNNDELDFTVADLLDAFSKFLTQKELDKPLNTKVANKEYSVKKRCLEIKNILKKQKKIEFKELFNDYKKDVVVVTFLAILSMSRNQEIYIEQENNFNNIIIKDMEAF